MILRGSCLMVKQNLKRRIFRDSPQLKIYGGSRSFFLQDKFLVIHETRVWKRCQRQYYFEYIAPYVKSAPVCRSRKNRWLKNFTSKFVVQGQIIHEIIDKQIQLHCENKPMDLNEAMMAFSKKVLLYKNIGSETSPNTITVRISRIHFLRTVKRRQNGLSNLLREVAGLPEPGMRATRRDDYVSGIRA